MNPEEQFCLNSHCHASGKTGEGNIGVHSKKENRYKCKCCGKTFSGRKGTPLFGLKKSPDLFFVVITLLVYGCPRKAIEAAFGLAEQTVRDWEQKAGAHCKELHGHLILSQTLDLEQVQADEIKVKGVGGSFWMALAMMVSTRLWLCGAVSPKRDKKLIQSLADQIRQIALYRPLLLAVDGLSSYVKAFQRAFRTSIRTGKLGAPRKIAWSSIHIVQVVKSSPGRDWTISRRLVHGCWQEVNRLIQSSQGDGTINTAFIERLNATFRQRLAMLSRRSRTAVARQETLEGLMMLIGSVYNFCTFHHSLRMKLELPPSARRHYRWRYVQRTPAMAAGLTNHRWSIAELLSFKVPTRYEPPKKRGPKPKIRCT